MPKRRSAVLVKQVHAVPDMLDEGILDFAPRWMPQHACRQVIFRLHAGGIQLASMNTQKKISRDGVNPLIVGEAVARVRRFALFCRSSVLEPLR